MQSVKNLESREVSETFCGMVIECQEISIFSSKVVQSWGVLYVTGSLSCSGNNIYATTILYYLVFSKPGK